MYTSIKLYTGNTITAGQPVGVTLNKTQGILEKGAKYSLQFKVINYTTNNTLNYIYVGSQKLSNVDISQGTVVETVNGKDVRLCVVEFTASSKMTNPVIKIGRNMVAGDTTNTLLYELTDFQLERGYKTDYSPNSNDLQSVKTSLESKINQLADSLQFYVAKNDFDNLGNNVSSALGQIDVTTEAISLKVEKTDIDNAINKIEVGNRNLLLNTGTKKTFVGNNTANQCSALYSFELRNKQNIKQSTVAIRFKYSVSQGATGTFRIQTNGAYSTDNGETAGEWVGLSSNINVTNKPSGVISKLHTLNVPEHKGFSGLQIRMDDFVGEVTIEECMLVEGGVLLSDWSPCPKDVEDSIDTKVNTAKAEIKVTTDAISQSVSNLNTTVSKKADGSTVTTLSNKVGALETNVNGISGRVASVESTNTTMTQNITKAQQDATKGINDAKSANDKATSAQSTANDNKASIGTLTTEVSEVKSNVATLDIDLSKITQRVASTETNIQTTTTKLDNLQVGGRNLLKDTSSELKNVTFSGWDYYFPNHLTTWVVGEQLTGRIYLKPTNQDASCMIHVRYTDSTYTQTRGSLVKAGTEGYSTVTTKVNPPSGKTVSHIQFSIRHSANNTPSDKVYYKEAKVEKGNKATDWTPAPEDIDSSIASVDSKVQTTNNKVASIETNLNGITQRVSSTESTVSSHTTQLGTVDTRINNAKNSAISTASSDATTKANNALASAKTDATTKANNALADAKTYTNGQITTVNTTINNKVAEIKATTDAITQRVSSTEATTTTLTTKVNTAQTTANNASNKIDTLKIGARNYVLNSGLTKNSSSFNFSGGVSRDTNKKTPNGNNSIYFNVSGLTADNWRSGNQSIGNKLEIGKTYTIGANVFVPSSHGIDRGASLEIICWNSSDARTGTFVAGINTSTVDKWQSLSQTFTVPNNTIRYSVQVYVVRNGRLYAGDYSLVEGDKSIWSIAPEDVQSQIDTAQSTADSATTKANNAQTTANTANNTANTANAQATTNKNNIATLTTTVSNTNSKVSSLETNLNSITSRVSATETTLTNTSNKLNNLQIGGRNLAKSTSNTFSNAYTNFTGVENTCPGLYNVLTDGLAVGDKVTVRLVYKYTNIVPTDGKTASCWIQGSGDVTGWNSGSFGGSDRKTISGSGEHTFLYTFTINADHLKNTQWSTNLRHDYVKSGSVQWKLFKVEKGEKATDWTPSPEDVQGKIDTAQSTANTANSTANTNKSNISSLTTRVSNAESKLTKDSLTTTIGSYYTTSTDVNNAITSKGYATTSQVQQTTNALQAKFSSSGGYNLLRNTGFLNGTSQWNTNATITVDTSKKYSTNNSLKLVSSGATGNVWRGFNQRFAQNIPSGKSYTATLYYRVEDKSTFNSSFALELKGLKTGATNETALKTVSVTSANMSNGHWKKLTLTATTSEQWDYLYVYPWVQQNGTVWISDIIVTEGELETPWSPHPSEIYDGITKIDKNGITVTQSNAKSKTTMSADGFAITRTDNNKDIFKVGSNGLLTLNGVFKCYKNDANMTGARLESSGAVMFGYNDTGGSNPVFASGLWTDENMGYFSVGYTRADISDANGCLWMSPQQGNTGCRLTYSKLVGSNVVNTNLYFQKDGAIDFTTTMRGANDTDDVYTYRFDSGVSTKSLRCDNLRTYRITPRSSGTYDIGRPTMRYKDIFADSMSTTNNQLRLGTVKSDGSWQTYGALDINSSTGYIFPHKGNGQLSLGTNGNRFHGIHLVNSPNVSSDERLKTDIHYLDEPMPKEPTIIDGRVERNMKITTKDMYDFVKDDLKLASYRYNLNLERGNTSTDYGFIAQDILYTKVGSELIQLEDKEDLNSTLSYNQGNYISTIVGALQEAINKIEVLEKKVQELESKLV